MILFSIRVESRVDPDQIATVFSKTEKSGINRTRAILWCCQGLKLDPIPNIFLRLRFSLGVCITFHQFGALSSNFQLNLFSQAYLH